MPESHRTTTTYRITPAAFAAWLHAHGQEPSVHVLAWFKAAGVAWPLVVVADPVQKADASPFPLADWSALVGYRTANSGKDWGAGNQIDIARAELGRRTAGGKATESDALTAMAQELGMNSGREALRKALKNTDRKRAKKKETVAASSSVTQVRDGKKQPRAA